MPTRRTSRRTSKITLEGNRRSRPSTPRRKATRSADVAGGRGLDAGELAGEDLENAPVLHKPVHVAGTTYQHELVKCGKAKCGKCRGGAAHGPYWYAYWREGSAVRKRYIGKELQFSHGSAASTPASATPASRSPATRPSRRSAADAIFGTRPAPKKKRARLNDPSSWSAELLAELDAGDE